MRPTRSQWEQTWPAVLALGENRASRLASTILEESNSLMRTFTSEAIEWTGAARDAAEERGQREHGRNKQVAFALEDFALECTAAMNALAPLVSEVRSLLIGAEAQGLTVTEDWTVMVPTSADSATANEAATLQGRLASFIDEFDRIDSRTARAINDITAVLREHAPEGEGLSAKQGREAGQLLGSERELTDSDLARIGQELRTAGLSAEQIRVLAEGGTVTDVPESTCEYLGELVGTAGLDGIMRLHDSFAAQATPDSAANIKALANALLIVSNENIGSAPGSTGGYDNLPADIRALLGDRYGDGPDANAEGQGPAPREMADFASLLASSDPSLPPGELLGIELGRQAANLELEAREARDHRSSPSMTGLGLDTYFASERDEHYSTALEDLLGVATRNPDASAALLAGTTSDGHAIEGYDRDATVIPLMTRHWEDPQPITAMLEWIGTDALSDDPGIRTRGQHGFTDLIEITTTTATGSGGNNFQELMSTSRGSLGQQNPALAQQLVASSAPYMNALGGMHHSLSGLDEIQYIAPGDSVRFMTLISTDGKAAEALAANVDIQQVMNASSVPHLGGAEAQVLGSANGRLSTYLESALTAEQGHREAYAREVDDHAKATRQGTTSVIAGTVGALPTVGAPVAGLLTAVFGDYTTPDGLVDYETFSRNADFGAEDRAVTLQQLQAIAIASGLPLDQYPEALIDHTGEPRPATVGEVVAQAEHPSQPQQLRSDLAEALHQHGLGHVLNRYEYGTEDATIRADAKPVSNEHYTRLARGDWDQS
ncbi:hypothetical protein HT102_01215 [Hoyosella sp. G463]|uniref:TPR repeat domain-containing protein n=1 Tax=Lolliginicoccus lacisalsi TaxID=2742202 RepID=A0A927J9L0_9ACTN|nr:hypothetical protein [Lolliginicoccus lacisalsi]MBD8505109.1 hypothetical protein [Lolliginicoccus lacisalsi]